jgi:hypothetical protein
MKQIEFLFKVAAKNYGSVLGPIFFFSINVIFNLGNSNFILGNANFNLGNSKFIFLKKTNFNLVLKQYVNTPNTYLLYCHVNIHRYCSYQTQQTHLACTPHVVSLLTKLFTNWKIFLRKRFGGLVPFCGGHTERGRVQNSNACVPWILSGEHRIMIVRRLSTI